jgi:hypothetical protein
MQIASARSLLAEIEADTSIHVSASVFKASHCTAVVRRARAVVAPAHQAPTLIGCSIVKEQFAPAPLHRNSAEAAKKEDYRASLI